MAQTLTLPTPPKEKPLRLSDDELTYLNEVLKLATSTREAMEATQEWKDAQEAAQASIDARTAIAKKFGMVNADKVDLKTGVITRVAQRPGQVGQMPGQRPAQVQE